MKLSIFFAGIRPEMWCALYDSISGSTTISDYELVIVSPCDLPRDLASKENVRLIKDWGCPSRCTQLGLLHSRGEYVTWVADDGVLCPTMALDKAFDLMPNHKKGVVMLKYQEGPNRMRRNWWRVDFHPPLQQRYVPKNYALIMTALMRRDYLVELGGWDCNFEQIGMGCPDLAIRIQNDGAEVVGGESFMNLELIKGSGGGHGPIVEALVQNDNQYFVKVYSNPKSAKRTKIDFDNWKNAPEIWSRRFTEDKRQKS